MQPVGIPKVFLIVADGVLVKPLPLRFGHGKGSIDNLAELGRTLKREALDAVAQRRKQGMAIFEDGNGSDGEGFNQVVRERVEGTGGAEEEAGVAEAVEPGLGDDPTGLAVREEGGRGIGAGQKDGLIEIGRVAEAALKMVSGDPKDVVAVEEVVFSRHGRDAVGMGVLSGK